LGYYGSVITVAPFGNKMEKEPEIFKAIKGFEGYYEISSWGRVKSLAKRWSVGVKKDSFLKHGIKRIKNKYLNVTFCVDKVKTVLRVHRLVAEYFCENPNSYNVVNHLDSDIFNNYYKNLEWTTSSGNTIHAYKNGRRIGMKGERNGMTKINETNVKEIRVMYKEEKISQPKIAILYGISQTQVSRIILNKRWNYIK